jgi:hypothetical protein
MKKKSNRLARFGGAALGMVLLAGLAFYQGHPGQTSVDQGAMIGTAILATGDSETDFTSGKELAAEEQIQISCETLDASSTVSQEAACLQTEQNSGG